MAAFLPHVFTEHEINLLPISLKTKLEEFLSADCKKNEDLNNEIIRLKSTAERYKFELERQTTDTQDKLNETISLKEVLKTQIAQLENKLSESQKQQLTSQESFSTVQEELEKLKTFYNKTNSEKEDLSGQLAKRRKEIEEQTDEIKQLNETIRTAKESKYEMQNKVEDADIKDLNFQHQIRKIEQEKLLFQGQIKHLMEDLGYANQEILQLKKDKNTSLLNAQIELEKNAEEKENLSTQMLEFKCQLEKKAIKIESLIKQLKETNDLQLQTEEQYQHELAAQTKLAELYKENSEENALKNKQLLASIEEMHNLLKESKESREDLELKLKENQNFFDSELTNKDDEIEHLKIELEHGNNLIAKGGLQIGDMGIFPTAQATSSILKSNLTYTQLYSELHRLKEELSQEKFENEKLSNNLAELIKEIETKTPMINQKYEELDKALNIIAFMKEQLSTLLQEKEEFQQAMDETLRERNHLNREVERQRQLSADLSKQVCNLLKELEDERGSYVMSGAPNQDLNVTSTEETEGNQVITQNLLTFKNIEELQEKNKNLLSYIRELTNAQEEQAKTSSDKRVKELESQLELTKQELEGLHRSRMQQAEVLEALVQQRDTYRKLAQNNEQLPPTPIKTYSTDVQDKESDLKELKAEFNLYKQEKSADTKTMIDQMETLRNEVSSLNILNSKLNAKLEYADKRFEMVQSNLNHQKREINTLRERNQKLSNSLTQHQQTINTLRNDLLTTQESQSKAEVTSENLRSERDYLKTIEARLQAESEGLRRENLHNSRLIANIQSVQNNLERLESNQHNQLRSQIDRLERDLGSATKKLEAEVERNHTSLKLWEGKNKELQQKHEKEVEKCSNLHDELVNAYSEVHALKQKISETSKQVSPLRPSTATSSPKRVDIINQDIQVSTLKSQLNDAKMEIQNLKDNLKIIRDSSEDYKKISADLEASLKEQSELCKQLENKIASNLNSYTQEKKLLEEELLTLKKKLENISREKTGAEESYSTKVFICFKSEK